MKMMRSNIKGMKRKKQQGMEDVPAAFCVTGRILADFFCFAESEKCDQRI